MKNEIPIIHSHGYNGSKPTRICPHYGEEKPLNDLGYGDMEKRPIKNQSWCIDYRFR